MAASGNKLPIVQQSLMREADHKAPAPIKVGLAWFAAERRRADEIRLLLLPDHVKAAFEADFKRPVHHCRWRPPGAVGSLQTGLPMTLSVDPHPCIVENVRSRWTQG